MNVRSAALVAALVGGTLAPAIALGQAESEGVLTPGDVVRLDRDFVGTLMSIEGATTLTVIGEGKQRCYPGQAHGEGPRCDPAPSIRRVIDWHGTTVERQLVEARHTKRTVVGALIGSGIMAPIGYLTGPSLGYGKVEGCTSGAVLSCADPTPPDVLERRQRARDRLRGSLLFGVVGATMGALVARATVEEWVVVRPPSASGQGAWSLSLRFPAPEP